MRGPPPKQTACARQNFEGRRAIHARGRPGHSRRDSTQHVHMPTGLGHIPSQTSGPAADRRGLGPWWTVSWPSRVAAHGPVGRGSHVRGDRAYGTAQGGGGAAAHTARRDAKLQNCAQACKAPGRSEPSAVSGGAGRRPPQSPLPWAHTLPPPPLRFFPAYILAAVAQRQVLPASTTGRPIAPGLQLRILPSFLPSSAQVKRLAGGSAQSLPSSTRASTRSSTKPMARP